MPYEQIDADKVRMRPLSERESYLDITAIAVDPDATADIAGWDKQLDRLAERLINARRQGSARMLAYGAHLVKNGAAPIVIRLMQEGWLTHVATNGAGAIHDFEFSYNRYSSESVRDNVATGTFGTWDETGRFIHLALLTGVAEKCGYGESVGRAIANQRLVLPQPQQLAEAIASDPAHEMTAARADLLHVMRKWSIPPGEMPMPCPWREFSILAQAWQTGVRATVHPGIGYDIIYTHPITSGSAIGRAGVIDFRIFAEGVRNLSGGVMLSVGSAIMAPQVFEKSLSMANNLLLQQGQPVHDHAIAVVDLADGGGWDWAKGEPPPNNPAYYLRFGKSYSRMGGQMQYFQLDNRSFLQGLYQRLKFR